jgi:hypothetical protein
MGTPDAKLSTLFLKGIIFGANCPPMFSTDLAMGENPRAMFRAEIPLGIFD